MYIQQSWDPARRTKVSREQQQYTSVYYYPGFFKAKLAIGNQIVKEHGLLIKTKGWLPVIEQKPVPVYFSEQEAMVGNELGLTPLQITDKNIPMQPRAPWVRYANIGNCGDLQTDSFRLDVTLKNDYREGSAVWQHTEVRVLCEDAAIIIPLCDKGRIFLDNKQVFRLPLPVTSYKIEGIDVRFQGTGRIRDVMLKRQ